jgi:hypothetical protein
MKKQELIDLSNWMRGNFVALREIGQTLMNTNALRGHQILGIAIGLDARAETLRKRADDMILDVRVAYLQEGGAVLVVLPDFLAAATPTKFAITCYAISGQHSSCSMKYARELPNAEPGPVLEMTKRHFAQLYSTFNLIEADIHSQEFDQ